MHAVAARLMATPQKHILVGIGTPYLIELSPGLTRVGRNPTNDCRIADATVSSFHCELEFVDGVLTVTDLKSTNGTFVDGRQVAESVVAAGQTLRLGSAEFRYEAPPAEEVNISIPELKPPPAEPEPAFLEDGSPACVQHRDTAARHKCDKCGLCYCNACVRMLRLAGGKPRYYCPACSGPCQRVAPPAKPQGRMRALLGQITQTIRLKK